MPFRPNPSFSPRSTEEQSLQELAAAAISQGVRDATWSNMGSHTWLLQNDDGFRFWRHVLGMDPHQIRQELSPNEMIEMSISVSEPACTRWF